jgi:LuxR family transcriptional regulator, maltose regulon positive regulatory protein
LEEHISPLVLTKLRAPAVRPGTISRARLVDQLTPKQDTHLILISAPAGYGKTTFLAEWAQILIVNGTSVAWYALDQSDDDPIPFSSYLIASFIQALGPHPDLTQKAQIMRSSPEVDLQRILPTIINAVISVNRECMLILDDYHRISSPAIHSALAYLLEHLPETLQIAISSRSDPPLPLARLRVSGQLLELRAESLRFTPAETAGFLNDVMQLDLSQEVRDELVTRSEGWAAGLQLAALSLAGRQDIESFLASFSGHRYLVEYLMEEVLGRQEEQLQSFLLATSILERMCAPLCDAILNKSSSSEAVLARLERANLFIVALDDQGYWYRYHHLFADFLKARLEKSDKEQASRLHRLASEWLASQGLLREAADQAFQTQDWEYAAAFVLRHSFSLIVHGDISTLYEWCSAFPEEVLQSHPMLNVQYCLALAYSFRRQNRDRIIARLGQVDRVVASQEDRQLALEVDELATVVRTFLAMVPDVNADPRELLNRALNILYHYSEGDPGQYSGLLLSSYAHMALQELPAAAHALKAAQHTALLGRLYFGYLEASFHLARLAYAQGKLSQANEICQQALVEIENLLEHAESELPATGSLHIALGCTLLELNQLEEAEHRLTNGLELIGWRTNHFYLMTGLLGLARLREIQGRPEEAIQSLQSLEETWPDTGFYMRGFEILVGLRSAPGNSTALAGATDWLREYSDLWDEDRTLPGLGPFGAADLYYLAELVAMRFQIATGHAGSALRKLEHSLPLVQSHGLASRIIELSLLEALAAQAQGDEGRAIPAIERALELGEKGSFVRIFDQGVEMTRLLAWAARHSRYGRYIDRLLASIRSPERLHTERQGISKRVFEASDLGLVETLSQRELEVLRLIALGASNQAIAEQLFITVGTVKSHINHLLHKLDAGNRTEAVARARQLGWLDL